MKYVLNEVFAFQSTTWSIMIRMCGAISYPHYLFASQRTTTAIANSIPSLIQLTSPGFPWRGPTLLLSSLFQDPFPPGFFVLGSVPLASLLWSVAAGDQNFGFA